MNYYFNTVLRTKNFEEAVEQVKAELKKEGFGVLSEIDIKATLKKKLGVDFRKYKILGACNPDFAYKSLLQEDKIGVFLPCNLIVEENEDGAIEVASVDPVASMLSVENVRLAEISGEVQEKLGRVIQNLA